MYTAEKNDVRYTAQMETMRCSSKRKSWLPNPNSPSPNPNPNPNPDSSEPCSAPFVFVVLSLSVYLSLSPPLSLPLSLSLWLSLSLSVPIEAVQEPDTLTVLRKVWKPKNMADGSKFRLAALVRVSAKSRAHQLDTAVCLLILGLPLRVLLCFVLCLRRCSAPVTPLGAAQRSVFTLLPVLR